jgi:hypothetical protein
MAARPIVLAMGRIVAEVKGYERPVYPPPEMARTFSIGLSRFVGWGIEVRV